MLDLRIPGVEELLCLGGWRAFLYGLDFAGWLDRVSLLASGRSAEELKIPGYLQALESVIHKVLGDLRIGDHYFVWITMAHLDRDLRSFVSSLVREDERLAGDPEIPLRELVDILSFGGWSIHHYLGDPFSTLSEFPLPPWSILTRMAERAEVDRAYKVLFPEISFYQVGPPWVFTVTLDRARFYASLYGIPWRPEPLEVDTDRFRELSKVGDLRVFSLQRIQVLEFRPFPGVEVLDLGSVGGPKDAALCCV